MTVALALVVLAGASIVWHTLTLGIGPSPTSRAVREALLALVPESLEGELHELGAGWGGLAVALARRCPKATVVAWERSPVPFLFLWARPRPRNLVVRFADLHGAPFERAAGVICYLFPGAMTRLEPALRARLPDGAFVLTHTFGLRGWSAEQTRAVDDLYRTPVYLYRPPRRG